MKRARILVVEDEAIVAMDIEDRLAHMGYEPVGRAASGEQALALAGRLRPDLLLMDVRLRGEMDGITTAEEILKHFHLPVIFLTAYSEDPTLERAKLAEPYGYILKPFEDRELKSTIEIALYKHRAEAQIMRQNAILAGIGRIFREALSAHTEEELGGLCLSVAREVTGSRAGFIREITQEGSLVDIAMSSPDWGVCAEADRGIPEVAPARLPICRLYEKVVSEGKGFFTNDPVCRTDSVGLPPGHPRVECFMGVPLERDGRTIGLIGLANREGGYNQDDLEAIEALTPAMVEAFFGKRSELALARSRADFEAIFNSISDAVVFADAARRILAVNPAFTTMFGYAPGEVLGKTTEFLYLDRNAYEERGQTHFNAEKEENRAAFETTLVHKNGDTLYVESIGVPVKDSRGEPIGLVGIHRDIAARKRAEAEREMLESQLLQAQKIEAVGRLAGGVAHDFNNMLGVIVGHAELALEQTELEDPRYLDLREIQKAAHRSADLTRQLLAFARKQTINPKVIELNRAISGMTTMLRRLIGEDIDLAWLPGNGLWNIKLDPSQVDQILANLVVNARDAISGVGKITLETSNVVFDDAYHASHPEFLPGHYVLLAISDDGCGMSPEVLDHIFEPFYTTKEVGKGTGLGLATVYGIVRQNNGFVHVYSEADHGTTFRIYFRRHEEEVVHARPERHQEAPSGGTEMVLIVEDEAAILRLGTTILERLGYRVLTAGTPGEAIRVAEEHAGDIDLLITDVVMPEMNGRELAERLLAIKPRMKCLYMSGYTANAITHHGVLDKDVRFIQKPFSVKSLAEKVRDSLRD